MCETERKDTYTQKTRSSLLIVAHVGAVFGFRHPEVHGHRENVDEIRGHRQIRCSRFDLRVWAYFTDSSSGNRSAQNTYHFRSGQDNRQCEAAQNHADRKERGRIFVRTRRVGGAHEYSRQQRQYVEQDHEERPPYAET